MKTAKLTGAKLDAAVAKALGLSYGFGAMKGDPGTKMCFIEPPEQRHDRTPDWFAPSSNWLDGGPIIEREHITLCYEHSTWLANIGAYIEDDGSLYSPSPSQFGDTPLIAAMRAFVSSKLGDDVEL